MKLSELLKKSLHDKICKECENYNLGKNQHTLKCSGCSRKYDDLFVPKVHNKLMVIDKSNLAKKEVWPLPVCSCGNVVSSDAKRNLGPLAQFKKENGTDERLNFEYDMNQEDRHVYFVPLEEKAPMIYCSEECSIHRQFSHADDQFWMLESGALQYWRDIDPKLSVVYDQIMAEKVGNPLPA